MASNAAEATGAGEGAADGKAPSGVHQSPRNTGGGGATAATVSTGNNNTPYVQMGSIEVPKALQDGEKFIKWDEVSYSRTKPFMSLVSMACWHHFSSENFN